MLTKVNNSKLTNPREVTLLQSKNENKSRDFEVVTRGYYFKRMYFSNYLTVFMHLKFELFSSKSAWNIECLYEVENSVSLNIFIHNIFKLKSFY